MQDNPRLSKAMTDPQASGSPTSAELPPSNIVLDVDRATDSDSAYGDEISIYSASLTSSVYHVVTEFGRQYPTFRERGSRIFPSDDKENDRLDIHHALMLTLLDGRLHFAPIGPNPQRVIDLGTGTGIWAIDFADQYPSAQVIGNDLTPIQPSAVPPNLSFVIDDFEKEWGYENQPFDFVHARYLATAVKDWPRLAQLAYKNLKPGGWVEFQDWDTHIYSTDGSLTEEHMLYRYHDFTCGRRDESGWTARPGPFLEGWVRDAGFINVRVHKLPIPLGTWPKDKKFQQIGAWNYAQFDAALESIALGCLSRTAGRDRPWTIDEVHALCAQTRNDIKRKDLHGQYDFFVVYGQKGDLAPSEHDE